MIELVFNNNELTIPKRLLPDSGQPFSHHFQSTKWDNLIELAGRVCYDSCKLEKTRSSEDYHKHINDVNHGSVQEHANYIISFPCYRPDVADYIMYSCLDRPGVCLNPTPGNNDLRIVANVRAIKEWSKFNNRFIDPKIPSDLGFCIQQLVKPLVPLALKDCNNTSQYFKGTLGQAHWPEERWYSFYISGVSRGLTHELVRHKYHTAISQRSTRYVDESESDWIWHPLIVKHIGLIDDMNAAGIRPTMHYAQDTYNDIVNILQDKLISEGIDKFQARKQSRGAARGILGNALSTELIWSASLDEIMRVIRQRASNGADAEIRLLANNLFELMKPEFDKLGIIYSTTPCSDGLGFEVTI